MLYLIRHLASFLALPFVVAGVVPYYLRKSETARPFAAGAMRYGLLALGVPFLAIGLALFASSLHHFFTRGRGTLAPWDPPRRLVVSGPYRWVRNPMISGVLFVVFGEALVLGSASVLRWAAAFLALNLVYIPLLEEPMLVSRFGASYEEYRRNVPRFLPRRRPWAPPEVTP